MVWTTSDQSTYKFEIEPMKKQKKPKSIDFFEEEKNLFIVDDDNEIRERK